MYLVAKKKTSKQNFIFLCSDGEWRTVRELSEVTGITANQIYHRIAALGFGHSDILIRGDLRDVKKRFKKNTLKVLRRESRRDEHQLETLYHLNDGRILTTSEVEEMTGISASGIRSRINKYGLSHPAVLVSGRLDTVAPVKKKVAEDENIVGGVLVKRDGTPVRPNGKFDDLLVENISAGKQSAGQTRGIVGVKEKKYTKINARRTIPKLLAINMSLFRRGFICEVELGTKLTGTTSGNQAVVNVNKDKFEVSDQW